MNEPKIQLTGPQLFLRYSWPCAPIRLRDGKMSNYEFAELQHQIVYGGEPPELLLRNCFPDAFQAYREYVTRTGGEMWSLDSVAQYWRFHHAPHKPPVGRDLWRVRVVRVNNEQIATVRHVEGDEFQVAIIEQYKLKVKAGNMVYIHKNTIIEIA